MGKGLTRARGEGNTEYVILLTFVLICAVVGLFTSYSGSIKRMQLEKGLCLDCKDRPTANTGTSPNPSTDPSANPNNSTNNPNGNNNTDLTRPGTSAGSSTPNAITSWWDSFRDFISWWY